MKLSFFSGSQLDRDDVVWCYRTLLGREPASADEIERHLGRKSLRAVVQALAQSTEFRADAAGAPSLRAPGVEAPTAHRIDAQTNEALAMAEFRAGVLQVNSTPPLMTLETTSRCNLRCVMCPHAIGAVDRPKHLEEDLVHQLGRFISQVKTIQLHGIGEPTLSPAFWRSLASLPAEAESSINTNFTQLGGERLRQLVGSSLRIVNVSLDAATASTYRRIRGADFDTVLDNVRRFVALRRELGKSGPLLYLNMTMMRSNVEEVPAFVDLAADLGADLVFLWHLNRMPDAEMARYRVNRDDWLFDYAAEGLWNHTALSNRMVLAAQARAAERGITLYLDHNKNVLFDEAVA